MAINKTSEAQRDAIRRASAQYLPPDPSARGMSPDEIRRAFFKPITDSSTSLLSELDRVVDEANRDLDGERAAREAALAAERDAREAAVSSLQEKDGALESALTELDARTEASLDGKLDKITPDAVRNYTIPAVNKLGKATTLTADLDTEGKIPLRDTSGGILVPTPLYDAHAVNLLHLNGQLDPINARLLEHTAMLHGVAKSFALESFFEFLGFLGGAAVPLEGATVYAADLATGDNLLIVEHAVPDFWFEKTSDTARLPETYEYNGTVYELVARDYDTGEQVGLFHILESDYTVIEGHATAASDAAIRARAAADEARGYAEEVKAALGDVSDITAALDGILAIQEALIGGDVS